MTPILVTGPAVEPVSLAEAKAWLRLENSADDDLVLALITSARMIVEASVRLLMVQQAWQLIFDAWPANGVLKIPLAPLRSLDAVRVYDTADVATTISPASYVLDSAPQEARLLFPTAPEAPGKPVAGIELQVTLGYGALASDVPQPLRQAIKMLVARWYENRGDAAEAAQQLPVDVAEVLAPFRRMRLK